MAPKSTGSAPLTPMDMLTWFHGLEVPDPITFITSPDYLNRHDLYPRQGTLIKTIFLRDDLFTQYDLDVIEEWTEAFRNTGNNGIQTDIMERIKWCQDDGRKWFREVVNVSGRRGGKGYLGALALAYVLWNYMAYGDPQAHYGVDRSKKLAMMVFAGKLQQAKEQVWRDVVNVIIEAPCFQPFIADLQAEKLTVYAPKDFAKMRNMKARGVNTEKMNMATFEIVPLPSTLMSGRGPASFAQAYDEMAHVVASGANRSAEEVYCLDPNTRVLRADLTWTRIDTLRPGDALVAMDEHPPGVAGSPRKLREATVLHKWDTVGTAYRVTLEDGSSVVCSGSHRWLRVRGPGGNARWASITPPPILRNGAGGNWAQLRVGDSIKHLVDPWGIDQSREGGYVSGIYDGEGHIRFDARGSMRVGFSQNPGPVRDYVVGLLEAAGFDLKHDKKSTTCQSFQITGVAECLRFLGTYQPLRLNQNARHLWQGRAARHRSDAKRVVSIEELPTQRLVDIETTTGTFIAEGLVSHNSAATPSLDQFGKDGFIYEPSSPWQMMGQFYENYTMSLQREPVKFNDDGSVAEDRPAYPTILMVQLTSWDPYEDWERSHIIPMYPEGYLEGVSTEDIPTYAPKKSAIQAYDQQMQSLERSNPETFSVERRSHFATALDAYLNPQKVDAMFTGVWHERPIVMQPSGKLHITYKAHGDPALVNDRFGFAVAHGEEDPDTGLMHCVFDVLHFWEAQDWPDNTIDYIHVERDLWGFLQAFKPEELTFDQWNSASSIQKLQMQVRQANFNKRVQVFCKPANSTYNFKRAETFKTALNMGWIHAPMAGTDRAVDVAINELKFLQFINGKIDHPDMGPVQSKDVADCIMECVQTIIGDQVNNFLAHSLGTQSPRGMMQGGADALARFSSPNDGNPTLSGFLAGRYGDRSERVARGSAMSNYLKTGVRRRQSGNPFQGRTPWDNT